MGDFLFQLDRVNLSLGGRRLLEDVSVCIGERERVCILGSSGAGKTTTLRVLGGMRNPDSGRVLFAGTELDFDRAREVRRVRSQIGFLHQDLALVPNLRASQNVIAGRLGQRGFWSSVRSMLFPAETELEEVHRLLESLGVGDRLFQRADTLSGGELQRVALARALYQQPRALLVDEPVSAVDPARGRRILELLCSQAEERSIPLIASLHDPNLAQAYFDRVLGLSAGRLVLDLPAQEVTSDQLDSLYRVAEASSET